MVFQLAYVSTAVAPWTQADLVALLEQARTGNEASGVTGMLLYRDRRFLQLLEGDRHVVTDLFARIVADPRHEGVTTVFERRRLLRQFTGWTMAFRDLGTDPFGLPGVDGVLDPAAGATDVTVGALVTRLRLVVPPGRPVVHANRVLGLVSDRALVTATG